MKNLTKIIGLMAACVMIAPLSGCGIMDGAQSSAREIMDAVVSGDVGGVVSRSTGDVNESNLPLFNGKMEEPIADVKVGQSQKNADDTRTVSVSYTVAGKQQTTNLNMEKNPSGKGWVAINPDLFRPMFFNDDSLTVGGKNGDKGYLMVPGVYRVAAKGDWYKGSWKLPVTANQDPMKPVEIEINDDNVKDIEITDAIKTNTKVQQSLVDNIANLPMCDKLQELYLNGQDLSFVVGDSISHACVYQVSEATPTITKYEKNSDGTVALTYDVSITGTMPEFKKESGTLPKSDDEWTCQTVSGPDNPVQCARFVEQTKTVKNLKSYCSLDSSCHFATDQQDAAESAIADVIYAGHGTD
ncbi:hypothetical protein GFD17_05330 [Bifidobacterium sp. SMB2]|uniref:Lipoprotein n=1 Tax=Bifidobacterium saimiriisciurei TaxID=2661627 RepID=A0ABX0CA87_9BIFI|nr:MULTISPECIES: hypothetical protein [Bifidobacterium]NEG96187.1 hypothetical protein [Bifidobacterium sp. SMB2]NEH10735.1 hypothetical protein [Bifidobacterium saimiriisciurei]